jgi:serine/threonine protein phosphatase PrpC
MKVIEVDDGSAFLLCTDGITRHIPDYELRDLLTSEGTPPQLCEEMKRRCYQRGAEDNLTAVIVQVGTQNLNDMPSRMRQLHHSTWNLLSSACGNRRYR